MKRAKILLTSILARVPAASWAGAVYVSLLGITVVGSSTFEAQVSISNLGRASRDVPGFFLAAGTDGTQRGPAVPRV